MMATKEQERAALAKIREIVEGLGKDSYIGTAFKGCFEVAKDNIENDFADSLYDRAERYEEYSAELIEKLQNDLAEIGAKYITEEGKARKLEQENMELKAKLYDMMIAQANA